MFEGREYQVRTDEAKKDEMFCSYCQVYRIRKDGKLGAQITGLGLSFSIYQASEKKGE